MKTAQPYSPRNGHLRSAAGYRAVFLDRDGVINAMVYHGDFGLLDSPQGPAEFELLPGVTDAIRALNEMGLLLIVVSNQPGIAKGKSSPQQLQAVTVRMNDELAAAGAHVDDVYYCLHHPEARLPAYRRDCDCRKPRPGLLFRAAQEYGIDIAGSFLVGDGLTDIQAGAAAGCTTVLVGRLKCDLCRAMVERRVQPHHIALSLAEAVEFIGGVVLGGLEVSIPREDEPCLSLSTRPM
jgi:D-glycero-D-manno-heptose 1,7-bisphosphate phosphatase